MEKKWEKMLKFDLFRIYAHGLIYGKVQYRYISGVQKNLPPTLQSVKWLLPDLGNFFSIFAQLLGCFWYAVQKSAKYEFVPECDICLKNCGQKVLFQHWAVWNTISSLLTDAEQTLTAILFCNSKVQYPIQEHLQKVFWGNLYGTPLK